MVIDELNLYTEIMKSMTEYKYSEENIEEFREASNVSKYFSSDPTLQRCVLTNYFYNVLTTSDAIVPSRVRIALNSATSNIAWLEDIKLVILPFIKENIDKFNLKINMLFNF